MITKFINTVKASAFVIGLTLAVDILISSILFLVKCPMTIFNLPISFIIASGIYFIINKAEIKEKLFSITIAFVLFLFSILAMGSVLDFSYDGNAYHKDAVGLLAEGWNPVYQDSSEVRGQNAGEDLKDMQSIWVDHYAKGNWIVGSSIYIITGNIESAKAINLLLIFVLFGLSLGYLYEKTKKIIPSVVFALMLSIMPINFIQIFSLYNDGVLYLTLTILVFGLLKFVDEKGQHSLETWLWLFLASLILINIKFTGLAYCMIFTGCFSLYYIWQNRQNVKNIIKSAVIFISIILCSVGIAGSNSYVKNFLDHKHPLYPLYGQGAVDIITNMQPQAWKDNNSVEKLFLSLFSKTDNVWSVVPGDPQLKIPFTVSKAEINAICIDTRVAGFGPLFGGLLLLSLVIIPFGLYNCFKKNKEIFGVLTLLTLTTIISVLLMPDSWWARYAPQLYYLPVISMFLLYLNNSSKLLRMLLVIMVILTFTNLSFSTKANIDTIRKSYITNEKLTKLENKKIDISLSSDHFVGTLFNLKDHNIYYNLVPYNSDYKGLYDYEIVYNDK